ncbi:hypothetical protein [Flavobacterium urumqiense]|uniref:Uncharacterized protein n=1 Tax=Flavobacterium urumqiense TaxID=935224 RepID=A0A1H5V4U0_9FLAO|nr:hypothetical protein [Flavobacterium urumqiense]SEF82309.1 hypothetical protein SAMN04488130_10362 [Flavobacterium urumqiense]
MAAASNNTGPHKYTPEWCKLDFFNSSNLKTDIQNRVSGHTATNFINALHDIKGDNRNGNGIQFAEIVRLAMAYFYSEIYTGKFTDHIYTLEMVKGFLDADNLTDYTAIHEIDVTFYKLKNAPYFRHCWLIIQSAWFFNSEHFGHHQHIDFVNHYIKTGDKLPIDSYDFDRVYLEKKYNDIDQAEIMQIPINGFTLVSQWYYGILFLVCKELDLPTTHFKIKIKDNREYNPLTKMSRQVRPLAPFKIIECDIKSAFPTFLDTLTGAKLKEHVYDNLKNSKNISRSEAKILFNKVCNSKKYKTKDFTAEFFIACGYAEENIKMLLYFTHNDHLTFFRFMTRREENAINTFVKQNNLGLGTRLHDALLFLDTKLKADSYNLKVNQNCDFGFKELNRPVYKESFKLSNKRLPHAYMNSIPKGLNLIARHDYSKPNMIGAANGFRFYDAKYEYISAAFNTNDFYIDGAIFNTNCKVMFSTLQYLNKQTTNHRHIYLILKHIRESSNIVFNLRAMYFKVKQHQYDASHILIKARDYELIEELKFKVKSDFVKVLNTSRGIVNYNYNLKELLFLIEERISNNDYGFLNELSVKGHKRNNLLVYVIVRKFNSLCNGIKRSPRKTVKREALYNTAIKSLPLNSITSTKRTSKATLARQNKKQERELTARNGFISNRPIAQQLLLIMEQIVDQKTDLKITEDMEIQNQLKLELLNTIDKCIYLDCEVAIKEFDKRFIMVKRVVPFLSNSENIYDTDITKSVFNQITIEEASIRGEPFFSEYLKFHNENEINAHNTVSQQSSETYKFSEIDFD